VKKIPTIFVRDMSKQPALVTTEWRGGCEWVRDGEGIPTRKNDGTCCLVRDGKLFKRRELKSGQPTPPDFEQADFDDETGKTVGWVPVTESTEDQWHREAFHGQPDGTYELMGPKVQGNKEGFPAHVLVPHGAESIQANPRTFEDIRDYLQEQYMEGLVWHHPDGRMAKIKRRDFGMKW
jgi:Family of unknown function (DUF5565)